MKNKYFIPLLLIVSVIIAAGCEKENPTLYENDPAIYFAQQFKSGLLYRDTDSTTVSFFDLLEDEHTILVRVVTQGLLDNENDRTFKVRQKPDSPEDKRYEAAIPGEDFISLDDPSVSSELYIPAGKRYGYIPITLKRSNHANEKQLELTLEIVANDEFRPGLQDKLIFKVKFSARPEEPTNWSRAWRDTFGEWGPVKHAFIVEKLGTIDWTDTDRPNALRTYWKGVMKLALAEYNAANPDNPLREPEEFGNRLVAF